MYFLFKFVASDSGGTTSTPWMDERVSNIITINNRTYLSCDELSFCLKMIRGNFPIIHDRSCFNLWRELARIDDDPESSIDWVEGTDCGMPNERKWVTSSNEIEYCWNEDWPEDYWVVLYSHYGQSDRRTRVKVRFTDFWGVDHWFYCVPWAAPG
jgi:hypothetical protein